MARKIKWLLTPVLEHMNPGPSHKYIELIYLEEYNN